MPPLGSLTLSVSLTPELVSPLGKKGETCLGLLILGLFIARPREYFGLGYGAACLIRCYPGDEDVFGNRGCDFLENGAVAIRVFRRDCIILNGIL